MGTLDPCRYSKNIFSALVILLFLSNGLNASDCKSGCSSADTGKLRFNPGGVYSYDFDSSITVSLTTDSYTKLNVVGEAQVYAEENCGYKLQLKKLTIQKDGKDYPFTEGLEHPVGFTMSNGELDDQICALPQDNEFSLNIKRALISMLQSSDKNYETDVFGRCPTTFSKTNIGPYEVVTKLRNLNACAYRETLANGFISGVFNENSGVKSTPLLSGDYSLEQKIRNGIIENVQLVEDYKYVPLSNSESSVRAKVITQLTLKDQSQASAPAVDGKSKSIIFKHANQAPAVNKDELRKALSDLVNEVSGSVHENAAKYFTEAIRLMRQASANDLFQLYNEAKSGNVHQDKVLARKVFLDSLFRTGTGPSVETIVNLITKKELKNVEVKLAYMSFDLANTVSKEALAAVTKLLDSHPPNEAYLSMGNLVNKFCKEHQCDNADIRAISNKFVSKLEGCKAATKEQENTIVYVLKGIRNTHKIANSAVDKLVQCTSEKNSARVRVAALQAFTAAACHKKAQTVALNLMKNRNEDSEIRIESYLAAIACPNGNVANQIAELLSSEPIYQVGSFISTHLQNLRASTDPYRELARHHFNNVKSMKKYPFDIKRYSFNHEFSYAFQSLGMGASTDSNVIYSQNSFLPRSARVNITGELFGYNFNMFEFSVRQENVESIFEHYFGPKGLFSKDDPQKVYDIIKSFTSEDGSSGSRPRRGVRGDVDSFAKTVKSSNSLNTGLNLDYSVKMFGNEFFFLSLGDHIPSDPDKLLRSALSHFSKAKSQNKKFAKEFEFYSLIVDNELIYPTGVGLPLELVAQTSAAAHVPFELDVDFRQLIDDWKNSEFKMKLVPSVSLDISGTLQVDGFLVSTGLRLSETLHSSTGSTIQLKLSGDGNAFELDVDLPFEKQNLFLLKSGFEFVTAERGHQLQSQSPKPALNPIVSRFDQYYRAIGITLLADIPNLGSDSKSNNIPSMLYGLSKVGLYLETYTKFRITGMHQSDANSHNWHLTFDTPGSPDSRMTDIDFLVQTEPKMFARASLTHPMKSLAGEIGLLNTDTEFALYGQYENNGETSIAKVGLKKSQSGNQKEFAPLIYVKTPKSQSDNISGYKASGKVVLAEDEQGTKYIFRDLQIIDPENQVININGWVQYRGAPIVISSDLQIQTSDNTFYILNDFEYGPNRIVIGATLKSSKQPVLNTQVSFTRDFEEKGSSNALVLAFGPELEQRFEISNSLYVDKSADMKVTFKNLFRADFYNAMLKLDGEYSRTQLNYDFEAKLKDKRIASDLVLNTNQKATGDYDGKLSLTLNRYNVIVKGKRAVEDLKSIVDYSLDSNFGVKLTAKGQIAHKFTLQDADVNLAGVFAFSNEETPYSWKFVFIGKPESVVSNAKIFNTENDPLFAYNAQLNRADKTTGTYDFVIRNLVQGDGSVSFKNGNGDSSAVLHFKKLDKKVKVDTVFNIAAPIYDVEATILYDYQKDESKKIILTTKNNIQLNSYDTANTFEFGDDKYVLNSKAERSGSMLNGDISGNYMLLLPNGRKLSGDLERHVQTQDDITSGTAFVKLYDTLPDNKQRSLVGEAQVSDFNLKAKLFNFDHTYTYTNFDNQQLIVKTNLNHLPHGEYKKAGAKVSISGDLIKQPYDLNVNVDEYCEVHAIYHVTGSYGEVVDGSLQGNYFLGGSTQPTTYKVNLLVNAPNTEYKSYNLQTNGKFLASSINNGVYEGEVTVENVIGQQNLHFTLKGKGSKDHGSWDLGYQVPNANPVKFTGTYMRQETDNSGNYMINCVYDYGDSKVIKVSLEGDLVADSSVSIHYVLTSTDERFKNVDMTFKGTRSHDNALSTNMALTYDGEAYSLNTVLALSDRKALADVTMSCPKRTVQFSGNFESFGERRGKLHLTILNLGDFSFDGSVDSNFQNFENFYLKLDANSEKLKLNQLHVEANSIANDNGKGVEFTASTAGKNILSGTANYNIKQVERKTVIEGSGNVQLYETPRNVNFKLTGQTYDLSRDGEVGFSYLFDGTFGPKKIVAEWKTTNKDFIATFTSCEDKAQCNNVNVKAQFIIYKNNTLHHNLQVLVDLRELGYPYDFELQSKTLRDYSKFEHELDVLITSNKNHKYRLNVSLLPTRSSFKFVLPRRTIELESIYQLPDGIFGRYESSVSLYLDRANKPDERSLLSLTCDMNHVPDQPINALAEFKFEHPTIRPLSIVGKADIDKQRETASSQLEFDLFKSPDQKIIAYVNYRNQAQEKRSYNVTTEAGVKSAGLGFEYVYSGHIGLSLERKQFSFAESIVSPVDDLKASSYVFIGPDNFEMLTSYFNRDIFSARGTYDKRNNAAAVSSEFRNFAGQPIKFDAKLTGITSASFTLQQPDGLFSIDASVEANNEGKLAFVGKGKQLFSGRMAFDAGHFLSTQYEIQDAEFDGFMTEFQQSMKDDIERSRQSIEQYIQHIKDMYKQQEDKIKNSLPEFNTLYKSYAQNFDDIMKELEADPVFQELLQSFKQAVESFKNSFTNVLKTWLESYKKLSTAVIALYEKLSTLFKEKLLPVLNDIAKDIANVIGNLCLEGLKLAGKLLENVAKTLKQYEGDFNKLGATFSELFKNWTGKVTKFYETIQKEFTDIWNLAIENLQTLPGLEEFKEKWNQLTKEWIGKSQIVKVVNEVFPALHTTLPTQESKKFVTDLQEYLNTKLKGTPVNDADALKSLYVSFIGAIRSIIVHSQFLQPTKAQLLPMPFSLDLLKEIPVWMAFKFSPYNYWRNVKFDFLPSLYLSRPKLDLFPPFDMHGHIADGEHIFTFDGRHLTFPGSCSYVLAQDFVHKNFTLVARLENARMKSLALLDKENVMEVFSDGTAKLNNKPVDFPVNQNNMHAWRRYYTVSLLTEYGVEVFCSLDLRVCHFTINGFYTGRVRGLLGNGNSEPYDDFVMPNGAVAENYANFGNAYALQKSCQKVAYDEHMMHHPSSPLCQQLFGTDSSLILGYLFIDQTLFREACNHAVMKASNQHEAACNIALTYASAARAQNLPVDVPSECIQCNANEATKRELDEYFETTPSEKADILFVVDTKIGQSATDLLKALIPDLKQKLEQRGITDVEVSVIGYDVDEKYPKLYTANGKLNINGVLTQFVTRGPKYPKSLVTGHAKIDEYLEKFFELEQLARMNSPYATDAKAFRLAMAYPFRSDAKKVIIPIRGNPLHYSNIFKVFEASFHNEYVKLKGVSLHLFEPLEGLEVEGKPVVTKNIVGFNAKHVITLNPAKDGKHGFADYRKKLKYKPDMGIDLVQSDGGYVYALDKFQKFKPNDRTKFIAAAATTMADQIGQTEIVHGCKCQAVYGLHAEESCIAKTTNFLGLEKALAG